MTWMFRSLATMLFVVGVGLTALPGCGGSAPTKPEKKEETKSTPTPNHTPNPDSNSNSTPPAPPKSTLGEVEKAADAAATTFLRELGQGTAKADALSTAFLKVVGKPLVLPSEKEKGYSPDTATDWLKKVGTGMNFFPALKRQQAGDVVYIRGSIAGPRLGKEQNLTGTYSLRLVKEGGAWKVDWVSLSSVDPEKVKITALPTAEGAAQEFAAVAFTETISDKDATPKSERAPLIAAAMTPTFRTAWAPPFDQDKLEGYDYSPGKIGTEATKIGGGTSAINITRVGDLPEFKVELTKPAGTSTYTIKLVKGTGPNEWLVSEITEAKK